MQIDSLENVLEAAADKAIEDTKRELGIDSIDTDNESHEDMLHDRAFSCALNDRILSSFTPTQQAYTIAVLLRDYNINEAFIVGEVDQCRRWDQVINQMYSDSIVLGVSYIAYEKAGFEALSAKDETIVEYDDSIRTVTIDPTQVMINIISDAKNRVENGDSAYTAANTVIDDYRQLIWGDWTPVEQVYFIEQTASQFDGYYIESEQLRSISYFEQAIETGILWHHIYGILEEELTD